MKNNHYAYLLKSKDDGRIYIGARTAPCGDPALDSQYKSSCKVVTADYKQNCRKRILATFPTRKEAIEFEATLHKKYKVASNPRFFNAAEQTSTGFCTYGVKLSEEHKAKITPLGRPMSEETKDKIRQKSYKECLTEDARYAMGARWRDKSMPEETRNKISEAKTGFKHSDEAKANMSATRQGKDNSNAKQVICVDTGVVYDTMQEAALAVDLKNYDSIWKACTGKQKKAKGFTWKYYSKKE